MIASALGINVLLQFNNKRCEASRVPISGHAYTELKSVSGIQCNGERYVYSSVPEEIDTFHCHREISQLDIALRRSYFYIHK